MFRISHQNKNFCISIAKYQIQPPFHIIDDDKKTHTAISIGL